MAETSFVAGVLPSFCMSHRTENFVPKQAALALRYLDGTFYPDRASCPMLPYLYRIVTGIYEKAQNALKAHCS